MNGYVKYVNIFLLKVKEKLYRDFNSELLNENMNLYKIINYIKPDILSLIYNFLSSKTSFNLKHYKEIGLNYTNAEKEYLDKYKIELNEAIENFIKEIQTDKLSFKDLKLVKRVEPNFRYYSKYIEEIKKIVNNDGIIFVNTKKNEFSDILIASYISNKIEIDIITNDSSKKYNIENWINNNKIIIKPKKKLFEEKNMDSINVKELYFAIEKYNSTGEKNEQINLMIQNSIKKIEKIINKEIKMKIYDFFTNLEIIMNEKEEGLTLEELKKLKNEAKDYNDKEKYRIKIKDKLLQKTNLTTNKIVEEIKNNYNIEIIKNNFKEIKNIYENEIENIKISPEELEKMQSSINEFNYYNQNIIRLDGIYLIKVNSNLNVSCEKKLNNKGNIVIINNIHKYKLSDVELIINDYKKAILIGDINNSEFKVIYDNISLFDKIKI